MPCLGWLWAAGKALIMNARVAELGTAGDWFALGASILSRFAGVTRRRLWILIPMFRMTCH